jgi:uncharacterized membrane protein
VLGQLIQSWTSLYSNHAALRTGIEFVHVGGLLAGGGCAITADLATISAARDRSATRAAHLQLLARTHRLVVSGLVALTISGLLLFGTDVETFLYSRVFWLKMGLVVLLLINGAVFVLGERRVKRDEAGAWFLTTLAGVALPNIG